MTTEETEAPRKRTGLLRTALATSMVVLQAGLAFAVFYVVVFLCQAMYWRLAAAPYLTTREMHYLGEIVDGKLLALLAATTVGEGPALLLSGFASALVAPRLGRWRVLVPIIALAWMYQGIAALANETMQGQHFLTSLSILCSAPGAILAAYVGTLIVPGAGWMPQRDVVSPASRGGPVDGEEHVSDPQNGTRARR